MQKLIPTIYFYVLSLIGFILLIIGIFASIHYVVNVTQYAKYPLGYDGPQRCAMTPGTMQSPASPENEITKPVLEQTSREDCLKGIEQERKQLQVTDLEKAISFTLIGLIVFGIHFYYARKKTEN